MVAGARHACRRRTPGTGLQDDRGRLRRTRLHHAGHRRFLNRDPLEEPGGHNLYAKVRNNFTNAWDYLGLWNAPNPVVDGIIQLPPFVVTATRLPVQEGLSFLNELTAQLRTFIAAAQEHAKRHQQGGSSKDGSDVDAGADDGESGGNGDGDLPIIRKAADCLGRKDPATGRVTAVRDFFGKMMPVPLHADLNRNVLRAALVSEGDLDAASTPLRLANWFKEQVQANGPWDYRADDPIYEAFGNYNYGATGSAAGIPAFVLLREAGRAQIGRDEEYKRDKPSGDGGYPGPRWLPFFGRAPYGDQRSDQFAIQGGIRGYFSGDRFVRIPCE